ncbi:hypothetical protein [Cytobacillus purgationiresistens]|uniref:Uncharacterized protein n=1 Tax=Cytobacillus purgationiresistens TaxID=863449 RepID=A0ABU0ACN8_9BACI|nr:hypothetical protein [Cytobacillus purgationiresistens]MDQ0269020.1 hypothetical protein [Cytobacillus purgationiresistens]
MLNEEIYGKIYKNVKYMGFSKVFKIIENDTVKPYLISYTPNKENYYELIKKCRKDGLKQVIINYEIMNELMFKTISSDGFI